MTYSAPDLPHFHARRIAGRVALSNGDTGRSVTWGSLDDRVGRATTVLIERGVMAGDRVCLVSENDPRVFELQFACMRLGAMFVPLNWRLSLVELAAIVADAEPAIMFHDGTWRSTAIALAGEASIDCVSWDDPDAAPEDAYDHLLTGAAWHRPINHTFDEPTHILYTSGTTGAPKGALSTHGTIYWQASNLALTSSLAGRSNMLCPIPLFHAGGLLTLAMPLLHFGGRVTTMRRFDPAEIFARLVDAGEPITHLSQIPAMYSAIAAQPGFENADLSSIRCGIVAGAIASPDLLQTWWDRGARLQPQYGGTEMGPCSLVIDVEDLEMAKRGSQGRPPIHTEVKLVSVTSGTDVEDGVDGEIWVRGPSIAVGYWRRDRSDYFTPDGWLRTGDVARRDADGYFYFTGRSKEMYKSGGENVYPAEVELVVSNDPDIADVAVVGVPDAIWGEVGLAVVVATSGRTPTLDSVRSFAGERLARYKLPARLVIVDELARNVTGKVSREELRRQYGQSTLPGEPAAV